MSAAVALSETERWLPAPGLEGRYEVSSLGRARNTSGRIRKLKCRDGYLFLTVAENGQTQNYPIARLVCGAFNGPAPAPSMDCDHVNRERGDNRPENLRWATRSENLANRVCASGSKHHNAKLNEGLVREIRASGLTSYELGRRLHIAPRTIRDVLSFKSWRHVA